METRCSAVDGKMRGSDTEIESRSGKSLAPPSSPISRISRLGRGQDATMLSVVVNHQTLVAMCRRWELGNVQSVSACLLAEHAYQWSAPASPALASIARPSARAPTCSVWHIDAMKAHMTILSHGEAMVWRASTPSQRKKRLIVVIKAAVMWAEARRSRLSSAPGLSTALIALPAYLPTVGIGTKEMACRCH